MNQTTTAALSAADQKWVSGLVQEGLLTEPQLQKALAFQQTTGGDLREILPKLGFVREHLLVQMLAREHQMHFIDPEGHELDDELMQKIPRQVLERHLMLPLKRGDEAVLLAVTDPNDFAAVDEVQFLAARSVEPALAPRSSVRKALNQYYQREGVRRRAAPRPSPEREAAEKVMALEADVLLKALALSLVEAGQVDVKRLLHFAALARGGDVDA